MTLNEKRRRAHDKLAAVREAALCQYPTASIDVMLSEIESGYGTHDGP